MKQKQKQIIMTRYAKITIVQDKDTQFDVVMINRKKDTNIINIIKIN